MMTDISEQKTLNMVYGALAAVTVLTLVPVMSVAVIALLLFIVVFIALYVVKAKAKADGVVENHMIYLIRTIWISSLWAVVTITLASLYLLPNYDPAALESCTNTVLDMAVASSTPDTAAMSAAMQPCMETFMEENKGVFLIASLIGAGPLLLYFVYRLFKGGSRAVKGYRLANPKAWF